MTTATLRQALRTMDPGDWRLFAVPAHQLRYAAETAWGRGNLKTRHEAGMVRAIRRK